MIYRPFSSLSSAKNAVFLAGPVTGWQKRMIQCLQEKGFAEDIIDPFNPDYGNDILESQTRWEWSGFRKASAIIFWIPRTKEHPALTTNIELGEWIGHPKSFVGFPKGTLNSEYIEIRCRMRGKSVFYTMEAIADAAIRYLNESNEVETTLFGLS